MNNILPTYPRSELTFTHGEGSYLYEKSGKKYLDFGTGIAVNSLGYSHPYLNQKLREQSEKLWHLSNVYQIPEQELLASRLCELCFADYAFFCNSGTEAVEASIKIARRYFHKTKNSKTKKEIISFSGSFHGRTIGALAAQGPEKMEIFNTAVNDFKLLKFGDHELLKSSINENTAAIILEPIQGEGGVREVPTFCLESIRKLCDENEVLLIFDEVQCGMGRTGKMFAYQWSNIEPDIMTIAKAIGNGFPIGACLTSKKVGDAMDFGSHGSTFGGNPLACSVGNAVLDLMTAPKFFTEVTTVSEKLLLDLNKVANDYPEIIEGIRGKGFILGLKCNINNEDFVKQARKNFILTVKASDNVVRLLPPINLSNSECDEAIDKIRSTCKELSS
jgi:acetylornithine/N-succinyldiaminopimelate aminotransferase